MAAIKMFTAITHERPSLIINSNPLQMTQFLKNQIPGIPLTNLPIGIQDLPVFRTGNLEMVVLNLAYKTSLA